MRMVFFYSPPVGLVDALRRPPRFAIFICLCRRLRTGSGHPCLLVRPLSAKSALMVLWALDRLDLARG